MRSIISYSIKLYFFFAVFIFLSSCFSKSSEKNEIPSFNLLLPDSSTVFNTSKIELGRPTIFFYFSPDCEHCQTETSDILKNINAFKKTNLYFITNDPFDRLLVFNKYYNIARYPNIVLGRDFNFSFPKFFKNCMPPYVIVYNNKKSLKAIFSGQTGSQKIITFVSKL